METRPWRTRAAVLLMLPGPKSGDERERCRDLSGVNPARVFAGYDVVLLWGQSNMSGRGGVPTAGLDPPANRRIRQFGARGAQAGMIARAEDPLAMHDYGTDKLVGVGPAMTFATGYISDIPADRSVLLVASAHGGTALCSDESPLGWRRGVRGNLYEQAIRQARGALAAAQDGARVVAVLWIQGETDGDRSVAPEDYERDLDHLIVGVRLDLGVPNLPFVIGQMVPEHLDVGTRAAIDAVHARTPRRLAATAYCPAPVGLSSGDGHHFNGEGARASGRNLLAGLRRVLGTSP